MSVTSVLRPADLLFPAVTSYTVTTARQADLHCSGVTARCLLFARSSALVSRSCQGLSLVNITTQTVRAAMTARGSRAVSGAKATQLASELAMRQARQLAMQKAIRPGLPRQERRPDARSRSGPGSHRPDLRVRLCQLEVSELTELPAGEQS